MSQLPVCHSSFFLSSSNDPRVRSAVYLHEHAIPSLMKRLLAEVLIQQPNDPKEFLANRLIELKEKNIQPNQCTIINLSNKEQETLFRMVRYTAYHTTNEQRYIDSIVGWGHRDVASWCGLGSIP